METSGECLWNMPYCAPEWWSEKSVKVDNTGSYIKPDILIIILLIVVVLYSSSSFLGKT